MLNSALCTPACLVPFSGAFWYFKGDRTFEDAVRRAINQSQHTLSHATALGLTPTPILLESKLYHFCHHHSNNLALFDIVNPQPNLPTQHYRYTSHRKCLVNVEELPLAALRLPRPGLLLLRLHLRMPATLPPLLLILPRRHPRCSSKLPLFRGARVRDCLDRWLALLRKEPLISCGANRP